MKKEELTREIVAVDLRGQNYTLNEFTEYTLAKSYNQSQWVAGPRRYALADGSPVIESEEGTFQIVETGIDLRTVK
jgi:hypothetical protein